MTTELKGQVAIVTGAGRGFGKAIGLRLAAEAAAVTVTSRTKAELDEVVAQIESAGGRALAVAGDATNRSDVARVVQAAREKFGLITLMVNNAGVPGPFGPIGVVDPEEWWAAQAIHVRAPFLFMSEVLPEMKERRNGRIINVVSLRVHKLTPSLSAYCLGKAAEFRLTELVNAEAKDHGVRAFAVDPGSVITSMAESTMASPEAQRWLPDMVELLHELKGRPGEEAVLAKCTQRCADLASGRYDALSGRYIGRDADLDDMLQQIQSSEAKLA
jgi:NAD(P)-dependent dehydrogenase (short-subunit alcohol dehydrogenase family)